MNQEPADQWILDRRRGAFWPADQCIMWVSCETAASKESAKSGRQPGLRMDDAKARLLSLFGLDHELAFCQGTHANEARPEIQIILC